MDLNDCCEVRFVSYPPTYDTLWEDVSLVLAKDNQIMYHLPAYFENNSIIFVKKFSRFGLCL